MPKPGQAPPVAAGRRAGTDLATLDELVPRLLAREPRAVARAITLVETGGDAQRELVRRIYPQTGRARVVGLTGPPGAGKSTLVDRLARLCRKRGETVGVLAVDPTSPYTGGALLGDRIRMQTHYTDPGVFIRSMATRGALGGLARATRDAVDLLDAAGFDWVLVETVGVGQDEVDVVKSVDTVVLVTVPGLGDDIQAIKAGILEIADVFVINKADREGVERTVRDLQMMLSLGGQHEAPHPGHGHAGHHGTAGGPAPQGSPPGETPDQGSPPGETPDQASPAGETPEYSPPILKTVAFREEGIEAVLEAVEEHRAWLAASGELARRRRSHLKLRVETILKERVVAAADRVLGLDREVERGFAAGSDPYRVADRLFEGVVHAAEEAAR
jgi:GTPase